MLTKQQKRPAMLPITEPMIQRTCVLLATTCIAILAARGEAQNTNATADSAVARNTTHEAAPSIRAARRDGAVRIDGRLDDAAWRTAEPFTAFRQIDPNEGQPGSQRTEARVLID